MKDNEEPLMNHCSAHIEPNKDCIACRSHLTEASRLEDYYLMPYHVSVGATPFQLSSDVRHFLKEGYKLYGDLVVTFDSVDDEFHYAQALVKGVMIKQ